MLGLVALLGDDRLLAAGPQQRSFDPLAARLPHFAARAKHVVWIFVNGGPSHVDSWDNKPALEKHHGKSIRAFAPEFKNTTGFFKNAVGSLMRSPFRFQRRGQCGKMVSDIFPHLIALYRALARHDEADAHSRALAAESPQVVGRQPALFEQTSMPLSNGLAQGQQSQ